MAVEFVASIPSRSLVIVPASAMDEETLHRVPRDKTFAWKMWQPRTLKLQRFYRGLVSWTAQAVGVTHDQLHVRMKVRYGLWQRVEFDHSEPVLVLRSTGFEAGLDEQEFRAYVSWCIDYILQEVLPGTPRNRLVRQIEQATGVADPREMAT